ncbi:MAG: serpin family protein [Polyangiaceae bacterium]|nr:serpin family protein [Polyangiaceae bacterium]
MKHLVLPTLLLCALAACDEPRTTTTTASREPATKSGTATKSAAVATGSGATGSTATSSGATGSEPAPPKPSEVTLPAKLATPAPAADLAALGASHAALGLDLYRKLGAESPGNFAMSPASIGFALGMTYLGARGDTATEMKRVLHVTLEPGPLERAYQSLLTAWLTPKDDATAPVLRVANRLFVERTLKVEEPFLASTRDGFGAPVELLDFVGAAEASRTRINGWVEAQTVGRISELMPPPAVTRDTRLVLTNALYFKGTWDEPFYEQATKTEPFWAEGTREVSVPTMHTLRHLGHRDAGDFAVLELPFGESAHYLMTILLPKKRDGLAALEASLDVARLMPLLRDLEHPRVDVALPRFKIEPGASLKLKDALEALGMKSAFDGGEADFTGIHRFAKPEDRLYVSQVFHKAFVDVGEKGAEAAAATAVSMARAGSAPPTDQPVPFVADHPFLFLLHDRAEILFIGRVVAPK